MVKEYIEVVVYECPYCGALVAISDAEETCWSCDKEVNYPGCERGCER